MPLVSAHRCRAAAHCVIRQSRLAGHFSPHAEAASLLHSRQSSRSSTECFLASSCYHHHHRPRLQHPQLHVRSLTTRRRRPQTQTLLHTVTSSSSPAQLTVIRTMASDSDYMAFLNKANSQREAGSTTSQAPADSSASSKQIRTTAVESGVSVPNALKEVDAFYISDTDEPFEPVVLKWEGATKGTWPSSDQFASLITDAASPGLSQAIETLSPSSFDPRDQYASVIKAVQAAAASEDVKVYRVEVGHNRIEYWIVALEAAEGRIVGLKADAIES